MVRLTEMFTKGRVRKSYLTLVKGRMPQPRGTIELPLAERQQTARSKERHGIKMQEARTRYRVLKQARECTLLECTIETGRTHQIRRHLVAIGHPVAGDRRYGDFSFNREAKARWGLNRLFLHARTLDFPHPEHGNTVHVEAALPPDLRDVMKRAAVEVT
jgi:23S rRNA pseudouridine955/2504/2580 synthase